MLLERRMWHIDVLREPFKTTIYIINVSIC